MRYCDCSYYSLQDGLCMLREESVTDTRHIQCLVEQDPEFKCEILEDENVLQSSM
jgi:hypothetical protein